MRNFFNIPMSEDDLFIVGHTIEVEISTDSENGDKWTLDGIFFNFQDAVSNMKDNQYIVRFPRNKMLSLDIQNPHQSWWKIDGEILKSSVFNDGDL